LLFAQGLRAMSRTWLRKSLADPKLRALYARPFSTERLATCRADLRRAQLVDAGLWTWAELTSATVITRASTMASNQSKPYQSLAIRRAGFGVPETLATTSPSAARAFWKRHRQVIYKSLSGVRSRVTRLGPEHAARLDDIVWCPTQFQVYVPGREHRVHVVGERLFACEIVSDADDYRYAQTPVELRSCTLPVDVGERCRRLAADLDLTVAGIDLRLAPDGTWYCFEVNPAPGFPFYEQASGPIGQAIAELLAGAPEQPLSTRRTRLT
jgi:glutathione synthase/RimK-type ligase-like ATP-grasp enzyme